MTALVYTTLGSADDARALAHILLNEKLIVCANIGAPQLAIYMQDGPVDETQEASLLCKTHRTLLEQAVARIEELHPYNSPVVAGWIANVAGTFVEEWTRSLLEPETRTD